VPDYRFDSLMGLNAVDKLMLALKQISGVPVPPRIERQRSQLQDAMLDTHFMLGQSKVAVAGDPDLLYGFSELMHSMGAEVMAAVAPARAAILERIPAAVVKIGDLEDVEKMIAHRQPDLLIGNSHAAHVAERLGCEFMRAGFPQYDLLGGFQRTWIGYSGTRQALFDLANLMTARGKGEIETYHSIYSQKQDTEINHIPAGGGYAVAAAVALG